MNDNVIQYTLIYVRNNSKLLLGFKKRGLGIHKWNGFGGKIENETILEGALRELKEECSLSSNNLNHIGVVIYEALNRARVDVVHIFTANDYSGIPTESEEMAPKWFDLDAIPYDNMWPDAKLWYPYMLNDRYFIASLIYKDDENMLSSDIKEHASLPSVLESVDKFITDVKSRSVM